MVRREPSPTAMCFHSIAWALGHVVICPGVICFGGCWTVVLSFLVSGYFSPVRASDRIDFFERRIRPVLVEHCYECHSGQAQRNDNLQGGLRLDTREFARGGGESGTAVVPGSVKDSLLIDALRYENGLEMPPNGKLPQRVIDDFAKWIEIGAPDPRDTPPAENTAPSASTLPEQGSDHWAFQPPRSHLLPAVADTAWPRNSWDFFVLSKLEERGVAPVASATKRELIRRVTFDLIGLPPTVDEVDAFLRDASPHAFDGVVGRLLASPLYGERWGRLWLDVARYADDKALAYHNPWPYAYRYRDWVVRALNNDMPYDRFVRLQLAGDLLSEPVTSYETRLAGLGFQGLGAFYHKGSVPKQVMADELDDRIDTLGRGLLGLTVACARCHDHKYDPISTQDYYSLAAAYNGADWSEVTLAPPDLIATYAKWQEEHKRMEADLKQWLNVQGSLIGRRELEQLDRYLLSAWRVRASKESGESVDEAAMAKQNDLSAYFLARCVKLLATSEPEKGPPTLASWINVARESVPAAASFRSTQSAADVTNKPARQPVPVPQKLQNATDQLVTQLAAAFEEHDRQNQAAAEQGESSGKNDKADSPKLAAEHQTILKAIWLDKESPFGFASDKDVEDLLDAGQRAQHESLQSGLSKHDQVAPPEPPAAHGVTGGGTAMHVNVRGNVERPGDLAPPGFLPVLRTGDSEQPVRETFTRLNLADAICTPGNPLTARVIVNRVWQQHFGRGIVGTASNFGKLGQPPTHPELLDTLAVQFMESGWSLKWLHRQIVGSATYQLSSRCEGAPPREDPDNRWLWRFTPRRLDVEAWRDAILAVSGQLDRTIGGPAAGRAEAGHVRRTIYSTISRREPDKMLVTFDFPDANVTSERRDVTTVPQQQLFVLNSEFMLQSARALAARSSALTDDRRRIEVIYGWAFGRYPTDDEQQLAREFLDAASQPGRDDQLTNWEQLCQAILAANEFSWID